MKTATVRQIRNAFPTLLALIRNGETVAITSRRKVVATLGPPLQPKRAKGTRPWAGLNAHYTALCQEPMLPISGAELLAQDRERFL